MTPIRLAIIGSGLFVQDAHVPSLLSLSKEYRIVAVCSRTLESAARLASLLPYAADATDDLESLLMRDDIDAFDVAAPIGVMPALLRKALASGKHVFSEKPIAPSSPVGEELIAVHAGNPGQIWMVGENWRIEPAFVRAAQLIADGAIGQPRVAQWTNFAALRPGDRYYATEWRRSAENDAGLILDGGVHHAAVLRLILGEAASVSAAIALQRPDLPPYDTVAATIAFRSGAICGYLVTYAFEAPWPSPLLVVGDSGAIKVDTSGLELTQGGETHTETFASAFFAVEDEFRAFAQAIRAGRLEHSGPQSALADVRLVEAIILAARSGTRVEVVPTALQVSQTQAP
jgi:predicted dehydrogenase